MTTQVVPAICLFSGCVVITVAGIGYWQIRLNYSTVRSKSPTDPSDAPLVTIIRPAKGLDPQLYECLASTFLQTYPKEKLSIRFCVASRDDDAVAVIEGLLRDFPGFDAQLLVESEDIRLQDMHGMGPNPKIRSISRAYREARGDLIWIIDCNVWVAKGVCGRMVDRLLGRAGHERAQRLVHQLPLVVDTPDTSAETSSVQPSSTIARDGSILSTKGGRLEEMFMSSSHAKFYTAINTVLIAPCLVGKSNMFRRSHLNALTAGQGIDYFSHNICEDHLIGDLLWKSPLPRDVIENNPNKSFGTHAMLFGDLVIQPMANMRVSEYIRRRVRWLRVRKYTVPAATLVEPMTESFLCSFLISYGLTTLSWVNAYIGLPQTWPAVAAAWTCIVATWAVVDWTLYCNIHSAASIEQDDHTPNFARRAGNGGARRPMVEWLAAWVGREALAFPIWFWAIFGGATVTWRGRKFWVGMNMRVIEIHDRLDPKYELLSRQKVQ